MHSQRGRLEQGKNYECFCAMNMGQTRRSPLQGLIYFYDCRGNLRVRPLSDVTKNLKYFCLVLEK